MEGSLFNLQQMVNDSNSESGSSYSSRTSNKSESQIIEPENLGKEDSSKEKSYYTKSENQTSKRSLSHINEMTNFKNHLIQKHDILQLKVGTILSEKKMYQKY